MAETVDRRARVLYARYANAAPFSSIYEVCSFCEKCPSVNVSSGTCFLVKDLNTATVTSVSSEFYFFVTAAHVLVCQDHRELCWVQVAHSWRSQDDAPRRGDAFLPDDETWIGRDQQHGYLAVHDGFMDRLRPGIDERDRYPYDVGLIALRKSIVPVQLREKLQATDSMLVAARERRDFIPNAFLCGFPGRVGGQAVRGDMYRVPEDKSIDGVEVEENDAPEMREWKERGKSGVYAMPQRHISTSKNADGESKDKENTGRDDVVRRLYRHYIDASEGQSGSPLYVTEDGGSVFRAIGIHLGLWKLPDGGDGDKNCRVAMRLDGELVDRELKVWVSKRAAAGAESAFRKPSRYSRRAPSDDFTPIRPARHDWRSKELRDVLDLEQLAEDLQNNGLRDHQIEPFAKNLAEKIKKEYVSNYTTLIEKHIGQKELDGKASADNLYGVLHWATAQPETPKVGDAFDALCEAAFANAKDFKRIMEDLEFKRYGN